MSILNLFPPTLKTFLCLIIISFVWEKKSKVCKVLSKLLHLKYVRCVPTRQAICLVGKKVFLFWEDGGVQNKCLSRRQQVQKPAPPTTIPNRQRTLNKLPSELRCRNFCYQAPTEHASRCQTCEKCVRNAYVFRLSFHFACHPLVVG